LRARHTSLPRLSTSHGRYFKKEKQSTRGKLLKKKTDEKKGRFLTAHNQADRDP
jgi:hypothetical protein